MPQRVVIARQGGFSAVRRAAGRTLRRGLRRGPATGVSQVLLFTDLANPTSNALYQRLGYQPVADRLVLAFSKEGG